MGKKSSFRNHQVRRHWCRREATVDLFRLYRDPLQIHVSRPRGLFRIDFVVVIKDWLYAPSFEPKSFLMLCETHSVYLFTSPI